MSKDNVISLENPDLLTGLLRSGARELIAKAVQTELAEFLSQYQDMTSSGGPLAVGLWSNLGRWSSRWLRKSFHRLRYLQKLEILFHILWQFFRGQETDIY